MVFTLVLVREADEMGALRSKPYRLSQIKGLKNPEKFVVRIRDIYLGRFMRHRLSRPIQW